MICEKQELKQLLFILEQEVKDIAVKLIGILLKKLNNVLIFLLLVMEILKLVMMLKE